jgi:DNA end-binding protein Ku
MHGREHATVIRSGRRGLILHTLFYENEVRTEEEYSTDAGLVNPKELDVAQMLIRAMASPFDPSKLHDTYSERLRALIDSRVYQAMVGDKREVASRAPVVDILEALRKSLAIARKPPKSEKAEQQGKAKIPKKRRARSLS